MISYNPNKRPTVEQQLYELTKRIEKLENEVKHVTEPEAKTAIKALTSKLPSLPVQLFKAVMQRNGSVVFGSVPSAMSGGLATLSGISLNPDNSHSTYSGFTAGATSDVVDFEFWWGTMGMYLLSKVDRNFGLLINFGGTWEYPTPYGPTLELFFTKSEPVLEWDVDWVMVGSDSTTHLPAYIKFTHPDKIRWIKIYFEEKKDIGLIFSHLHPE
jgi:hypothetical protein